MDLKIILNYLKCNKCGSHDLVVVTPKPAGNLSMGECIECNKCHNQYPVDDGIIVTEPFLWRRNDRPAGNKKFGTTFKSYSNWWLKVNKGIGYKQDLGLLFKEQTGKDKEFLAGKSVLDAGCGGGRFVSYVSQSIDSKIIAFDLGQGLLLAKEKNKNANNIAYVQGNLLNPPFRKDVFDFVYSFGVLHHTPDPENAFNKISGLVKTGGHFAIYLYYRPHLTFKNWGIIYMLQQIYLYLYREPIRRFVQILPHPLILLFSRIVYYRGPVCDYFQKRNCSRIATFLKILIPTSVWKPLESKEHNVIRNYDYYSTRYNYDHSHEEVLLWYQASSFDKVQIRRLPVTMIGEKVDAVMDPINVTYSRPNPSLWADVEAIGIEKQQ